jgi:hypothetical protein
VTLQWTGQYVEAEPFVPGVGLLGPIKSVRVGRSLDLDEIMRCGKAGEIYQRPRDLTTVEVAQGWAGLEPALRILLEELGHDVVREDEPPLESWPPPARKAYESKQLIDIALLNTLATRKRLLVRHDPDRVDVAQLIAQFRWAWPKLRIVVLVELEEDAIRLHDAIRSQKVRSVLRTKSERNSLTKTSGVVVATADSAERLNWYKAQLVVVPTATTVLRITPSQLWILSRASNARFLGLLDRSASLLPDEQALLNGVFGLQEFVLPGQGLVQSKVRVIFVSSRGNRALDADLNGRSLKHRAIWLDDRRNQLVCRLAKAIRAKSPHLGDFPKVASALQGRDSPSVLIMVEAVEHAKQLEKRLPDWTLVTRPNAVSECSTQVVATWAALKRKDLAAFDVIVRADGSSAVPDLALVSPLTKLALNSPCLLC